MRLTWDALGERRYELGVDRGVLYREFENRYTNGIPWIGLTGVDDNAGGRDSTPLYSGSIKSTAEYTPEEYSGTIKCYTYPDEFEEYLGESEIGTGIFARQQARNLFGFSYRSRIGNDVEGVDYGYRIHLIYNMIVTDFSRSYSTINDSMDIGETEISFDSFPFELDSDDYEPMSEIVIDSRFVDSEILTRLEDILYGKDGSDDPARLPYPDEIIAMFESEQVLPEDWYLFPNLLVYPKEDLYPYTREV